MDKHIFISRMTQETSVGSAVDDLQKLSQILNTGLDRDTLVAAIECIELGANPKALGSEYSKINFIKSESVSKTVRSAMTRIPSHFKPS